jgi:hypothetical protein
VSDRLLELQDNGGTSAPRATTTGGAWAHAPPQEIQENKGIWLGFLPSSLPRRRWGSPSSAKVEKDARQSVLIFLCFSDLLSVLCFLDLFLLQILFFSFFVSPSSLFQVADGMSKDGRQLSFCRVCAAAGGWMEGRPNSIGDWRRRSWNGQQEERVRGKKIV